MYVRLLLLWGCWLALGLGARPARAQTPDAGPGLTVPTAPPLASPPLPPAATAPTAAPRRLAHARVLKLEAEPAELALVRRLHPRPTVPDSLTALRTVRELVLALQADAYLLASADTMRWGRDTVRVHLYVGEQFRWAYLRNGNLGDGLLTRAKSFSGALPGGPPTGWPCRSASWAKPKTRATPLPR